MNNIYKNKDILGTEYYLSYPTQECLDNHDNMGAYGSIYESTYYWTRTRNANEPHNNMRFISPWGDVWSSSATASYGIRPAFYLDVDNCTFKTGKGSLENPYLIHLWESTSVIKPLSKAVKADIVR